MKNITTEYYFSKTAFVFIILLVFSFVLIMTYLSYSTYFTPSPYNENKFVGIMFLLGLVLLMLAIRQCILTITKSLISNRPALILTPENLIDNLNECKIKWTEIDDISLKDNYSGKMSQNFIPITLKDSEKTIKISDRSIKCQR